MKELGEFMKKNGMSKKEGKKNYKKQIKKWEKMRNKKGE